MKSFTIRFDNSKIATHAARALRQRGFTVNRDQNDVMVKTSAYEKVERALKDWSLNRGALPTWHLIEF